MAASRAADASEPAAAAAAAAADMAPLEDAELARRAALMQEPKPPMLAPPNAVMGGRYVVLVPYSGSAHAEALFAVSDGRPFDLAERHVDAYDPVDKVRPRRLAQRWSHSQDLTRIGPFLTSPLPVQVWRFMPDGPFATATALQAALDAHAELPTTRAYTVLDAGTGHPVGFVTAMAHQPQHLKVELGYIWFGPIVQGTMCATEAIYLLLRFCFDSVGYRRVEWKCDAANARSRRAADRLGFAFEGVQAWHMVVKGRNRDTAWYRMLRPEWPSIRRRLEITLQWKEPHGM